MKDGFIIKRRKPAFVAWSNTDLTEGRGRQYAKFICDSRTTAERLGKKESVQGSNCNVTEMTLLEVDGEWFGPVFIHSASPQDIANDEKVNRKLAAIAAAKAAGLTEEQLEALTFS